MSQENYTIIPLLGVDVSGNNVISTTTNTISFGLSNALTTLNASAVVTVTVASTANLRNGQIVTISGATILNNISAVNLNITAPITIVSSTTFSYVAGAAANATGSGGGTAIILAIPLNPTEYNPGDRLVCADGTERMFVQGTVANIAANNVVIVDALGNAQNMTTALVTNTVLTAAYTIAVSPMAIAYSATTPNFGWVITRGACTVNVTAATTVGTALYSTTTAGQVSITAAGSFLILGLLPTVASAGAGSCAAIATNPTLGINNGGSL